MTSPFPGTDPFLEQFWGDVPARLTVYMCDQINEQLPHDLQARVDESVMIDLEENASIDYTRPLGPQLGDDDRTWAEELLRERDRGPQ